MACANYPTPGDVAQMQAREPEIAYVDSTGRHHDAHGHVVGWTDSTGRHHDAHGHVVGWTGDDGRYHDQGGHVTGWIDELGGVHGVVPVPPDGPGDD